MAPSATPEDFQRLVLDKQDQDQDQKALASPYGTTEGGNDIQEGTIRDVSTRFSQQSERKSTAETGLSSSWYGGDDGSGISGTNSIRNGQTTGKNAGDLNRANIHDAGNPETTFRKRSTSISFDSRARTDDGAQLSLEEGPSRSDSTTNKQPGSAKTSLSGGSQTGRSPRLDPDRVKINPFTGEPVRRRSRKSELMPKLETIDSYNDSANTPDTSTPSKDPNRTPVLDQGFFLPSPAGISTPSFSPSQEGSPWPGSRDNSYKSNGPSILRRSSRRSSYKRTGSASFSPASAFLSSYSRSNSISAAPTPDDEGASFGVDKSYIIGRQIGYGGFSVVKEAFTISPTGERLKHAVKIVRKTSPDRDDTENERLQSQHDHEISIWRLLCHKNILPLHAVYDTDFASFCVMDLLDGGSLYDTVIAARKTPSKTLPLPTVQTYAFQLACALRYLHQDMQLIHRDIKLENCLLDLSSASPVVKVTDFGLADWISSSTSSPSLAPQDEWNDHESSWAPLVGSLAYAAPEALEGSYKGADPKGDVYAFGVCVYTLLTGGLPFRHALQPVLVEMILEGKWDRDAVGRVLDGGDKGDVIEVLEGCLCRDRGRRWGIEDVLASEWLRGCGDPYEG